MRGADEIDDDRPIGDLVSRLIDEGKAYGRAELALLRAHAEAQVDHLRKPAVSIAIAIAFALGGVIALVMTLVLWLASLLGPLAGGLLATVAAFLIAGGFVWLARRQWMTRP